MDPQAWFFGDANMLAELFDRIVDAVDFAALARVNKQCAVAASRTAKKNIVLRKVINDDHLVMVYHVRPGGQLHGVYYGHRGHDGAILSSGTFNDGRLNGRIINVFKNGVEVINITNGKQTEAVCINTSDRYIFKTITVIMKNQTDVCCGCRCQMMILTHMPGAYCYMCAPQSVREYHKKREHYLNLRQYTTL